MRNATRALLVTFVIIIVTGPTADVAWGECAVLMDGCYTEMGGEVYSAVVSSDTSETVVRMWFNHPNPDCPCFWDLSFNPPQSGDIIGLEVDHIDFYDPTHRFVTRIYYPDGKCYKAVGRFTFQEPCECIPPSGWENVFDFHLDCDGGPGAGLDDTSPQVNPAVGLLGSSRPNPFSASTGLSFALRYGDHVEASVYNATGQRVRTLVDSDMPPGDHYLSWDGRDDVGQRVASGVYFLKLEAGEIRETRRIVLVK